MPSSLPRAVQVVLSEEKLRVDYVGPSLVTFPDITPPPSTQFALHRPTDDSLNHQLMTGQTAELAFKAQSVDQPNCNYLLGLYSSQNSQLTLFPTRAYEMRPIVKRLKKFKIESNRKSQGDQTQPNHGQEDFRSSRQELGIMFGNQKTRRAIRNAARNQINPETMIDLEDRLSKAIAQNSTSKPDPNSLSQSDSNPQGLDGVRRPLPPFNDRAGLPKDVYQLSDLVPALELNSISFDKLTKIKEVERALQMLPLPQSRFTQLRIQPLWSKLTEGGEESMGTLSKGIIKKLKILIYINHMIAFRHSNVFNFKAIHTRLSCPLNNQNCPESIVQGLLNRFTESTRSFDENHQHVNDKNVTPSYSQQPRHCMITNFTMNKLLSFISILCLILDDFTCDFTSLAQDLKEHPNRMKEIFKGVGCRIRKAKVGESQSEDTMDHSSIDPSSSKSQQHRIAQLVVPLEFPIKRQKRRTN